MEYVSKVVGSIPILGSIKPRLVITAAFLAAQKGGDLTQDGYLIRDTCLTALAQP
jgi:hypothetical protein